MLDKMNEPGGNRFRYQSYRNFLMLFKKEGYHYSNYQTTQRPVILRHDVVFDLPAALQLAEFEYKNFPEIRSTYFVLITSEFYNVFGKESRDIIR